ncbi:MAG: c-type cytochrome, partial [Phycisphaerae bacterium]
RDPLRVMPPEADDASAHARADSTHADSGHADEGATNGDDGEPHAGEWPPFDEMTPAMQNQYVGALVATVNTHFRSQNRKEIQFTEPLLAHPQLDLFVGANSPHPMSKMGCTSCHEGNGQETDFIYAAHTPGSHDQEHEWAETYYDKVWGIPRATFHLIEEYWDRPMLHPKYTQATCAKCHTDISDLTSYRGAGTAERLTKGRRLFTQLGCINCHLVQGMGDSRQVGPDLASVGYKLETGFIQNWIHYPADFRPSTRMPHFFRQENNLPSSANPNDPDPTLRTETEAQAITHYLETFSGPYDPLPLPEGVTGDAARGAELFVATGCLACHSSLATVDPSDSNGRTFGRAWIEEDLVHGQGLEREAAAARVGGMSLNEQARYAVKHFTEERHAAAKRELESLRTTGEDTDDLYIPPNFTRFGPELSGVGSKLAPDGNDAGQAELGLRWLYNWLREPRHYGKNTKMPRLFGENYYWREPDVTKRRALSDQDLMDVASYLLTLRHDEFDAEAFPDDAEHRSATESAILALLGSQYSEAESQGWISDKPSGGSSHGRLTDAIVQQVQRSIGREAGLARVQSQDLAGRRKLYLGVRMITHYGCYACHNIPGYETAARPGTEQTYWGEKRLTQLDFAFYAPAYASFREGEGARFDPLYPASAEYEHLVQAAGNEEVDAMHNRASFAHYKLRNPRVWDRGKIKKPYEKLKMPNYYLAEDEVDALVTYLLSRVHPLVGPGVQVDYDKTPLGGVAAGRHLVEELNCIGCHKIEDNEPAVQQYGIINDPAGGIMVDELNLPPWLHGQGAKVNHNWLHVFLRDVEMLRPWLN